MRKVIVVIDMQNDFIDGALGTKEAQAMLPHLVAKLEREKDALLIFTQDTHSKNYMETQEGRNLPVPHCIKPEKGWEIAPSLQPFVKKAAAVIEKLAFGSLELPKAVAKLQPDEVELVGLCTDICVISNAMILKAAFPELPVAVDASCCAGVTPASHDNALQAMKMCQVDIR
ncbi:cysteine hydrolase family protein [uncultured Mitsuokella sp.]|uniref:cysteine hydrolase family protein n=1 Tax=uncultured Mitsuokella sp. TaxID=453120 RepID=UPI0025DB46F1|nr:isochorismatase family cysteine hydrolase [uncultured Mitsuokella sp.]